MKTVNENNFDDPIEGHFLVTMKQVDDQLITALEGGSNYWYLLPTRKIANPENWRRNTRVHYEFLDKVYQGGTLPVNDIESGEALGNLTLDSIKKGLDLFLTNYRLHYLDMVNESGDATTADVFFQLCIMGEVVFC